MSPSDMILQQGYTLSCVRYLTSNNPSAVISATAMRYSKDPRIDTGTTANLTFASLKSGEEPVRSIIKCDFAIPPRWGLIPRLPDLSVRAVCERGSIEIFNYVMPVIYHSITVRPDGKVPRTEKAYTFEGGKGEEWWTTYRYQLEAFVDKVKGRTPQTWVSPEDSIANMEWIEKIYEEVSVPHISAVVCLIGWTCRADLDLDLNPHMSSQLLDDKLVNIVEHVLKPYVYSVGFETHHFCYPVPHGPRSVSACA